MSKKKYIGNFPYGFKNEEQSLNPDVLEKMWIFFRLNHDDFKDKVDEATADQLRIQFQGEEYANFKESLYYRYYHDYYKHAFWLLTQHEGALPLTLACTFNHTQIKQFSILRINGLYITFVRKLPRRDLDLINECLIEKDCIGQYVLNELYEIEK